MTDTKTPPTWPRSQKFSLSATGSEAEAKYRASIVASRHEEGRASYDAARQRWAVEFALQPDDALYLGEARGGPVTVTDLVDSLDSCGKTKRDALSALERLVGRGFIRAV